MQKNINLFILVFTILFCTYLIYFPFDFPKTNFEWTDIGTLIVRMLITMLFYIISILLIGLTVSMLNKELGQKIKKSILTAILTFLVFIFLGYLRGISLS